MSPGEWLAAGRVVVGLERESTGTSGCHGQPSLHRHGREAAAVESGNGGVRGDVATGRLTATIAGEGWCSEGCGLRVVCEQLSPQCVVHEQEAFDVDLHTLAHPEHSIRTG